MRCSDRFVDKLGLWGGSGANFNEASAYDLVFHWKSLPIWDLFAFRKDVTLPSRFVVENGVKVERTVSAKEFRDNADECMGWVRTARSDRERAIFLQMAETWLQAAARADGRLERVELELTTLEQSKVDQ
jgi:hypothetical protein